ncbi:MAG: hypothetical protein JNJ73_10875 [Hyphomonadaceae bacterium]|nr:hypothetical protein [Hyphomonadaceae bacterium]
MRMLKVWLVALALAVSSGAFASRTAAAEEPPQPLGRTIDVGRTGFAERRPVITGACPQACPWYELASFLKEAMAPEGYDFVICENCNLAEAPRLVAHRRVPPPILPPHARHGVTTRFDAVPDMGVTTMQFLTQAYAGTGIYSSEAPMRNLRLLARIEDPTYLLIAVRADTGVTDLGQVLSRRIPVRIVAVGQGAQIVLDHYGLTPEAVAAVGGSIATNIPDREQVGAFNVLISDIGSAANNPESAFWAVAAERSDLRFLDVPDAVAAYLIANNGYERVTLRWGFLRGVDRNVATIARSGEAFFARDDAPDADVRAIVKAIDEKRANLRWFVRPYSYEPRTVWQGDGVPLHPAAARYYRQQGYMRARR